MASANLDLVRSIMAALEQGEFLPTASTTELLHPEIEFVIADGPSPGRWTALAGMAEGLRDWLSAWEDFRSDANEYREIDGERVLVLAQISARGKRSGLEIGHRKRASVLHVRGGKVTRYVATGTTSARSLISASLPRATLRDGLAEARPRDRGHGQQQLPLVGRP
jgi:ketosteroid isomerase-like protein